MSLIKYIFCPKHAKFVSIRDNEEVKMNHGQTVISTASRDKGKIMGR